MRQHQKEQTWAHLLEQYNGVLERVNGLEQKLLKCGERCCNIESQIDKLKEWMGLGKSGLLPPTDHERWFSVSFVAGE